MNSTPALLLCGALLAGCAKDKTDPDQSTGVAACDEYLKMAEECASRHPEVRDKMEAPIHQTRELFKAQLAAPGGEERLERHCKQTAARLAPRCM